MARQESDREDLFAEATALRERVEISYSSGGGSLFGYREQGSLSMYLTPDRVYHFDERLRLRRAYVEGVLFRSEGKSLARLRRVREEGKSELLRSDLDERELELFLGELTKEVAELNRMLEEGSYEVGRQFPEEGDVVGRLKGDLREMLEKRVGLSPALK